MPRRVLMGEEAFARIFHDVEVLGVPIYMGMIRAIVAFETSQLGACAQHVADIVVQLRWVLGCYFNNMHDQVIAQTVWLSHIQGFQAWGIGHYDEQTQHWEKYDGLSGNQVLLFQALDAFLDIAQYLSPKDQMRNVPMRQRDFCHALRTHSFRRKLEGLQGNQSIDAVKAYLDEIVVKLRVSRSIYLTPRALTVRYSCFDQRIAQGQRHIYPSQHQKDSV